MAALKHMLTDPIVGRIWRAVPRAVDPSLRDDIIGEMYLAIREGRLHPRNIEAEARRYISAAFSTFANRWGDISLDAAMSGDDERSMIGLIPDPSALEAFERIDFRSKTV